MYWVGFVVDSLPVDCFGVDYLLVDCLPVKTELPVECFVVENHIGKRETDLVVDCWLVNTGKRSSGGVL